MPHSRRVSTGPASHARQEAPLAHSGGAGLCVREIGRWRVRSYLHEIVVEVEDGRSVILGFLS